MLRSTKEEIITVVKKATTDSDKNITYDPENRPEVANLLTLISLMSGKNQFDIAKEIGDGGAKMLKEMLIETTDSFLTPIRERRKHFEENPQYVEKIIKKSIDKARYEANKTLQGVLKYMNMSVFNK